MEVTYTGDYQRGAIEKFNRWIKSVGRVGKIYTDEENNNIIIIYSTRLCDLSIKFALMKNRNGDPNPLKIVESISILF